MSTKSAGLAKKMGYSNIKVMLKGVPGWKKSGQQLVASDGFVNKGNIVLVDLRAPEAVAKGHIARAVNIPFDELEDAEDDFPRKAPIVLYGGKAKQAYKMIAKWGMKGVALLDGGLEGYISRGNSLTTGSAATDITWVRKLGKGEVGVDEFMAAANSDNVSQMILDVRTNDEVGEGIFGNSISIPLDDLEARFGELDKGKEYLVHCSTGARAEMANASLKKANFKSRFLVADVSCDGTCTAD